MLYLLRGQFNLQLLHPIVELDSQKEYIDIMEGQLTPEQREYQKQLYAMRFGKGK